MAYCGDQELMRSIKLLKNKIRIGQLSPDKKQELYQIVTYYLSDCDLDNCTNAETLRYLFTGWYMNNMDKNYK